MTTFWVLAAGLIGLALLFVMTPILSRRAHNGDIDENDVNLAVFRQQMEELEADLAVGNLDQDQYESSRHDLEKELLIDIDTDPEASVTNERSGRWAAVVLAVLVPVMAVGLYLGISDQQLLEQVTGTPGAVASPAGQQGEMPSMEVLVQRLAERMEQNPDNAQGWIMLGRSYIAMGQHAEAVQSFEKARALAPDEPDVLLGYAESLAKAQGSMAGKPAELISAALELDPSNPNGLWMGGLMEFQRDNPGKAVAHWSKLQVLLEPGSEDAQAIKAYIAEARQAAGLEPKISEQTATPAPMTVQAAQGEGEPQATEGTAESVAVRDEVEPQATESATESVAVRVQVSIDDRLSGQFAPDDTLFVFARALQGPPMPLAVQRLRAADLPATLSLDDSMAMMPQMRLSNFEQVVIGARISKSGNAMPQSGDLQGEVSPVTPAEHPTVKVFIEHVRP